MVSVLTCQRCSANTANNQRYLWPPNRDEITCLPGLAKQSAKNKAGLSPPQTPRLLTPPRHRLTQCMQTHRYVGSLWLITAHYCLWWKDCFICGDVQQYDGAASAGQSACLITKTFKLALFPPVTVFIKVHISWQLWETSVLFHLSVLGIEPQTALKISWWQIPGIGYHSLPLHLATLCSARSVVITSTTARESGIAIPQDIPIDLPRKVNNYFTLVSQRKLLKYSGEYVLISSLSNIHLVCIWTSGGLLHPTASTAAGVCRLEYKPTLLLTRKQGKWVDQILNTL